MFKNNQKKKQMREQLSLIKERYSNGERLTAQRHTLKGYEKWGEEWGQFLEENR